MKWCSKLLLIASVLFLCNACADDYVDIVPDEIATEDDAFADPESAKDYLYSVYGYMPNKRDGTFTLDLLNSDEIASSMQHESFARMKLGNFTASNPIISFYEMLYKGIRQGNIFKERIGEVDGISDTKVQEYIAEADFLIAYYYFYLLKAYGPLVLIDKVGDIETPQDQYAERSTVTEVANYIVTKLDAAASALPGSRSGNDYGRVTSVAAKAMKAKVLFWMASPLFNGGGNDKPSIYTGFFNSEGTPFIPTTYDRNKWKEAADALKEAINSAEAQGIELYTNGSSMESSLPVDPIERNLRYTFVDKNTNEVIWAETREETVYNFQLKTTPKIPGTDNAMNGVGPTLEIIEEFYTKNGLPIDKDPAYDYNNRYDIVNTSLGTTMGLNVDREPRFNAWISYHNGYYEVKRGDDDQVLTQYRLNDAQGRKGRNENYSPTGYLNKKGVHPLLDQSNWQVSEQYPWPIIRLSELYLSYAEALIEYGEDMATAKEYIDKVRVRAGIPTIDEAWAVIGGANDQTTLRNIVRQERTIELYLEGHRYWDLRRWQIADEYLNHKVHGMNIGGASDEEFFQVKEVDFSRKFSDANYLLPIPQTEVDNNEKMVQNPGY